MKPIASAVANALVRKMHYSGKHVPSSNIHFGAFLNDQCLGVMSFGPPMDKRKSIGLVAGTRWNEMLELNRMAFSDKLPRNSESRCMSVAFKILKKKYPHLKWILSFADATQCGDGTIYRASGFVLTGINRNKTIGEMDGQIIAKKTLNNFNHVKISGSYKKPENFHLLDGYQMRYVYFLDKNSRKNLTAREIPFSKIKELGVSMYRGQRAGSRDIAATEYHSVEGGENPTPALQHSLVAGE